MLLLFFLHSATAAPSPAAEPSATVYAADPLTNRCTGRPLYYARGDFIFAADAVGGKPTNKIIRFVVGDRI